MDERGADEWVRGFSTRHQLSALLYARLSGAVSLREIEAGMSSHQARLSHARAKPARRSNLADANRLVPRRFSGLYDDLA